MATHERVAAMITDLGQSLGIPELELDEENQCLLSFDQDVLISLRVDHERWVFLGFLNEWEPHQNVETALEETVALLTLNLTLGSTGRGTICLDTTSDSVLLVVPIVPPPESVADLSRTLEGVMESIEWIRERRSQSIVDSNASSESSPFPVHDGLIP
jgi:hypothetical protein